MDKYKISLEGIQYSKEVAMKHKTIELDPIFVLKELGYNIPSYTIEQVIEDVLQKYKEDLEVLL